MSKKPATPSTEKQGHSLPFIYPYAHMFARPPEEADMQRHFRVSPPSVHQMVLTIERAGFIRRQPGVARKSTSQNLCAEVLVQEELQVRWRPDDTISKTLCVLRQPPDRQRS